MTEQERAFGEAGHWLYGPSENRDPKRARPVVERLHAEKFAPASFALGMMYYDGLGVRRDYARAFACLQAAADRRYPSAEVMVGTYHETGLKGAVPRDEPLAREYYRRAAEKGNSGAQYNLGRMLRGGPGGEADPAEAYVWQSLSVIRSPIRNRPSEVQASQLAEEFDSGALAALDARVAEMAAAMPEEPVDHLFHWRRLAGV